MNIHDGLPVRGPLREQIRNALGSHRIFIVSDLRKAASVRTGDDQIKEPGWFSVISALHPDRRNSFRAIWRDHNVEGIGVEGRVGGGINKRSARIGLAICVASALLVATT
jgi:hypothetical protein